MHTWVVYTAPASTSETKFNSVNGVGILKDAKFAVFTSTKPLTHAQCERPIKGLFTQLKLRTRGGGSIHAHLRPRLHYLH